MVRAPFSLKAIDRIDTYPMGLQSLIRTLQETPSITPERVKDIVLAANVSPQELMPWADFDHPVHDSYGRKLVFDGGHFEIMIMSWAPGDFSAIHDHGSTQWGAVQCFGAAEHYIYRFSKGVLNMAEPAHYSPGMVHAVDHSLIHQMGNAGHEPFLSLHVYGCVGGQGTITGNARIFDLLDETVQYTDGGVFFCLPDTYINRRRPGLRADRNTTLKHHFLMSDRIRRILKAQYNHALANKLALLHEKMYALL